MRKCVHCGVKLSDKAVVCVKCGYLQPAVVYSSVPAIQAPPAPEYEEFPEIQIVPKETAAVSTAPAKRLKTNRGLLKFILLSVITFGIYGLVVMSVVSRDINTIASRYDGRKTMHYCWICFVFFWLTFGIAPLVWSHRICDRIGRELVRRRIDYSFGPETFWGWGFFGSLIFVGPFIYTHKLLKSMNLLAAHYNVNG